MKASRHPMFVTAALAIVIGLLLVHALDATFSHDEEQYVFGALLAKDLSLYRDFAYLQTPYYPLILAPVLALSPDHYFLIARLLSWVLSTATVLLIFALGRRITGDSRIACLFAILFATSTVMLEAFGSARNDIMPCFFAVLGLYFLQLAQSQGSRWRTGNYVLAGFALAAAAGTKVLYGFYPAVALIYVVWSRQSPWKEHLRSVVVPFAAGLMLGTAPVLFYALTRWDLFLFQTFIYHRTAPIDWYTINGLQRALTFRNQVMAIPKFLFQDTTLVMGVFVAVVLAAARAAGSLGSVYRQFRDHGGVLYAALLALGLVFCLMPRPSHVMYFPPLVPALILALIAMYAAAKHNGMSMLIKPVVVGSAAVSAFPGVLVLLLHLTQPPQDWLVNDVHHASEQIRAALKARGLPDGPVATLSPIRVIDSGTTVYREFATGPFLYRSGDLWGPERLNSVVAASPRTLEQVFENAPPVAIYTGFEAGWRHDPDKSLEAYAERHGYVRVEGNFGGGKLFVQAAAAISAGS